MNSNPSQVKSQLTEWGLPPLIVSWFRKKGITSLFDWQIESLCKNDVLFGGNLVYSAPTSAGKTLVADFLLIKKVLESGKKALVIEPFVALTREKAITLKSMLFTTKARVGMFGGNYYTPGGMAAVSVAVCTIEKANNFINRLINEEKLGDLGIIVVDEIHYLGDERRGYQLELLLTKVLYFNSLQENHRKIQIVGLSATVPNLESIAIWLNASLYTTDYRPVPLIEKIKVEKNIYQVDSFIKNASCQPIESIAPGKIILEKDFDDVFYLCIDSIINGHSTLVFCESKRECEIMSSNLASQISYCGGQVDSKNPNRADVAKRLRSNLSPEKIRDVLKKLQKCPAGADKELFNSLKFGVAFHHAGLTSEEREIIEDGFKSCAVKVLMATSTLSSGVNLPARKVVIRAPTQIVSTGSSYKKDMLNPSTYRQMIGRAGRKNIDTCGESILICRPENQEIAFKLIKSSLGNIESSLGQRLLGSEGEPSGLKKAILEVIANGTTKNRLQLNQYLKSTFWLCTSSIKEEQAFMQTVTETIRYLTAKKFIEELKPGIFRSTRLGNAALVSGLHPDECLELLQDLSRARQGFILLSDLHIIYQVTPNDIARTIEIKDWQHFSQIWNSLDEVSQAVGERIGIDEVAIARKCQGFTSTISEDRERIYKRFWTALVINDLISEVPLPKICAKYQMSKATVQNAQRTVAQFAGVMSNFCNELGYNNIAALVTPLESRINFSCQRDLLDLIRLNITRPIARNLFNAGYKTIISVAKADKLDIEFVIRQSKPFKKDASFTIREDTPSIWVPELAKNMSTLDYASHIVDSARNCVEIELEIDFVPTKKRDEEVKSSGEESALESSEATESPRKRSRIEDINGPEIETHESQNDDDMVRAGNRTTPNFVTKYLGSSDEEIGRFIEKWTTHSSISVNFKIEQQVNQPIGVNFRRSRRIQKQQSANNPGDDSDSQEEADADGLALNLEIDSKKHIVTRLYTCFDDNLTVYIVDKGDALEKVRQLLCRRLKDSNALTSASQNRLGPKTTRLYTQNIVTTYKVLYAAFGIDQLTLNRNFEWYSFDVAWWMINGCPNRGHNNANRSLSRVAKTKWAVRYHHFLHPGAKRQRFADQREQLRLKDIFKSGKTAILKPLITEILAEVYNRNQIKAYFEAEVLSRVTMSHMMVYGIGLNKRHLNDEVQLYDDLLIQLEDIAQQYYAKSKISLANTRHVARVLYDDLDLKGYLLDYCTTSDISRKPTNVEILNILSRFHPFPKLVQDHRRITKALEALQAVNTKARYNSELKMMRVFGECDFWQLTGRVAMFEPDLFLINKNFAVTIPPHADREEEVVDCAPRRCFVPAKGLVFVAADYSQLELRLLAHFSRDKNLLEIMNRVPTDEGVCDVFKTVASKVFQKSINEVTDEMRQHAKRICYGIIYGMGNKTLASKLGVDQEKAVEFREYFFGAFPTIHVFTDSLLDECEKTGYVESLLGRRRNIEGINSDNSFDKSRAERQAVNTKIQSSASDIIKLAMQRVNQRIIDNFELNQARLVLEMHDELIYEVDPAISEGFAKILKSTMENITNTEKLDVKLLVNLKKGPNWANLEAFTVST